LLSLLWLLSLAVSRRASGQGFGIYEHGTCAMGRAGATVADPCDDGSAIFFNPAALAGQQGWRTSAGVTLFVVTGGFTADETGRETELDVAPIPLPHLYITYGLSDRLAAGLGVFVPYGLQTKWPLDFEGRFLGYDNSLFSFYVHPTVAYRPLDWLSIGGGPILVISRASLNQRIDLSTQPLPALPGVPPGTTFGQLGIPFHTDFADAQFEASGATGFGGHFAVRVQATKRLSFGGRYMSRVPLDYEGDADFTQVRTGIALPGNNPFGLPAGTPLDLLLSQAGIFAEDGPLADQEGSAEITMPDQLILGLAYRFSSRLQLLADWQWVNWSEFDRVVIEFTNPSTPSSVRIENYDDTNAIRVGAEYEIDPTWSLRGGYLFHQAASPDATVTPLLPEANRNEVTAGIGWRASDLLELNLAYQYIRQDDRRGRVREAPPGEVPTAELNSGLFDFTGHLFGGTVTLRF
jgi:long-chain fatty acid transport protein